MPPKLETLFDRCAANLAALRPELRGSVLCPICLRSFDRSAIGVNTDDGLSREHVPPSKVGSSLVTLTCRRCNSKHGSFLDGHFVQMIRSRDGTPVKGTIRHGDVELPMRLSGGVGEAPIDIRIHGGSDTALRDFSSGLAHWDGAEFELRTNLGYVKSNADRALLRMGYLALFERFGYRYVFSEAAAFARELIDGYHSDHLRRFLPQLRNLEETGIGRAVIVFPVPIDAKRTSAYLILLCIDSVVTRHHAVLLPGPTVSGASILQVLDDVRSRPMRVSLRSGRSLESFQHSR
jgi:hypothetical protein